MAGTTQFTLEQILAACNGRRVSSGAFAGKPILTVAAIHDAGPDSITWIADPKHAKHVATTRAAAVIGTRELLNECPKGILVADPELAIAQVLALFDVPPSLPAIGIHPSAVVDESARLAEGVRVGAHAVIHADTVIGPGATIHEGVSLGRQVQIGKNCALFDRCVLYDRTVLGNNVILHAGVVLGADGFGYIFRDGKHLKLPHIGNVVIEDDVEIGPNSVVDRGKLGPTRIGRGSKIDALVMIGHNVQMGPLCVLAGQAGVSGSARLGAGVVVGGQAGFSHGITIGDHAKVGAQSAVMSDIPSGRTIQGTPAQDSFAQMRDYVRIRKLQKLYGEVAELTRRVKALEAAANHREHD